jgi:hypothetical protein
MGILLIRNSKLLSPQLKGFELSRSEVVVKYFTAAPCDALWPSESRIEKKFSWLWRITNFDLPGAIRGSSVQWNVQQ